MYLLQTRLRIYRSAQSASVDDNRRSSSAYVPSSTPRDMSNSNVRQYLQLLEHLDALVSERHVTRAAEKLGIGQPAMSGALARLRDIFRDPILVKTGAGMEPTPRAIHLNQAINEALRLIDEAISADEDFDLATATGNFRVLASESIAHLVLPLLMREVRQKAPHLQISFFPGDVRVMLNLLRDAEADLALGSVRNPPESLYCTMIYPQSLVCIANAQHPTIRGFITLEQLVAFPHVVWGGSPVPYPTMEMMVEEALSHCGVTRTVGVRIPNVMLAPHIVAESDLLSIVPERIAFAAHRAGRIQILPLPFTIDSIDLSMFWHERKHRDPVHTWVRSIIKSVAADLAATSKAPRVDTP
jgi:LysR family transcriptional regulator, mexEF-oprN operon transcriptional activator